MKRLLNYIATISLVGLALTTGCLKGEEVNTTRIGLALSSAGNSWWHTATYYAVTQASNLQQPYFLANADSASQQQIQLTAMAYPTLQQEACKAIILSDLGQSVDSIQKYIDTGIGIILFDCDMAVDYTCRISGDNAAAGKAAGEFIRTHLPDPAATTLIIQVQDSPVGTTRAEGCKAQLTTPVMEVTSTAYTQAAGKKAMEEALAAANGAQIGAVYAADDDVAIGVLTALQEAENTTVKTVVGCGGSQTFLLLIHTTADLNLATTVYSPEGIKQCVDIANTLTIQGTQPAQKEYITEMPLVDRNNAADYINPASRY